MNSLPLRKRTTSSSLCSRVRPITQSTVFLLTGQIDRRFDADFVTLSKLVNSGSLGRISEFESHFDRHRPEEPAAGAHKWKNQVMPGGSAVYDLGAHLLDQAVVLLGKPQRVTGFVGSAREVNSSQYEDTFTVLLHYANGTMVTTKATVVSPEDKQLRFWVRGEKGSFKKVRIC
jgi:predicted dehydrogenase